MINGLTFNGKHSYHDFGLRMHSKNRPILPEPYIAVEEVPGRDDVYDYSAVNPDKREKYKPRPHDIDFGIIESDPRILRIRAHKIAAWLACGEKQLIYDDETAVFYLGKVVNRLDLETQVTALKMFTVSFRTRPFAFSRVKSNEAIQYGQGLQYGYGYKYGMVPTIFTVAGNTAYSIYNPGWFVKPIIRVNGSFTNITFAANGRSFTYHTPTVGALVEFDCENLKAIKDGSINVLNNVTGDNRLEFANGDNLLQVSGTGLNLTLTLEFRYLYL